MDKFIKLLENFPKKRIAVGVLLFNESNELLILKPGYKEEWTLPGGVVEEKESPIEGAIREAREEIRIEINILKCLAIDFKKKKIGDCVDESLQILFLGNFLSKKDISHIKIDKTEIVEWKFVEVKEAQRMLNKYLSGRLKCLKGNYQDFIFLENGKRVL